MRLFSEITTSENTIIEEGILSILSNIFGDTSGKVVGGLKRFTKNSKSLPNKIKLIYKLTISSLNDIVDEEEKISAEELLASYKDTEDIDEIAKLNYDYLKKNRFPKSKFNFNLMYLTKEICFSSKNPQIRDYGKDLSKLASNSKVNTGIENKVENELKDTKKEVTKKEVTKKEEPKVEDKPKEEIKEQPSEEISKKEIEKVVKTDPIKELCEKVNIDSSKLYNVMFQHVADDKSLQDNADDIIIGLSAITCGALILKNNLDIKPILKSVGLNDNDEFIKNLEKVAN